jgi:putative isomerase
VIPLILLLLATGARAQELLRVGTLDPAQVNSLVFVAGSQTQAPSFFGLRVLVYRQGETLEEAPPPGRIALFGPHAADGSYARLHWETPFDRKPVTLQWSRLNQQVVAGRFSTLARVRVALEAYRPFAAPNDAARVNYRAQDVRTIVGEQLARQRPARAPRFLLRVERNAAGAASYNDPAALRAALLKEGHALPLQADANAVYGLHQFGALSFELNEREAVSFVVVIGDDFAALERAAEKQLEQPLARLLAEQEDRHEATRPRSDGWLGDGLEALQRAANWNRIYLPETQFEFISSLRAPVSEPKQLVRSWDAFFRALAAAQLDPLSAMATVRALLSEQTGDGRVSPALAQDKRETGALAGRSLPPVGVLCAWKIYLATQDVVFLSAVYAPLKRWHEWWLADRGDSRAWRDGNGDGLLEWGYDAELELGEIGARQLPLSFKAQAALQESGSPQSPQWSLADPPSAESPDTTRFNERAHTLELTPVGLNALYALEAEILYLMARELGLKEDATRWEAQYQKLRALIEARLWSEQDKLYLNRHWQGAFSQHLTPELFYVLAAGLPTRERARQLLETLRDPKKFGGAWPVPTLARDDVAFTPSGRSRGRVEAVSNYLVYLGLKRYGFAAEASELARQSVLLVRRAWLREGKTFDSFASVEAASEEALKEEQSSDEATWFGGLLWLPGVEELLSLDPWAGLTIGSQSVSEEAALHHLPVGADLYDIALAPQRMTVQRNGQPELETDAPLRLFNYRAAERAFSFFSETGKEINVRIPPLAGREISISLDGKLIGSAQAGKAARFKLPAGVHRVVIVR